MTSFHNIWFSKLHILYNLIEAISLPNFIGLGCLDQILRGGRWKTPPTDLHALTKPSPYRVKRKQTCEIVKHFMETSAHSVNDFRIMGIIQLENPPGSKADLKKRLIEFEDYWQIKLQTIEPYGINTILEYLEAKGAKGGYFLPGSDQLRFEVLGTD